VTHWQRRDTGGFWTPATIFGGGPSAVGSGGWPDSPSNWLRSRKIEWTRVTAACAAIRPRGATAYELLTFLHDASVERL
jgi:hypothetical protein